MTEGTETKINEKYISVRGKATLRDSVDFGEDLEVTVTVDGLSDKDNFDGTVDRTYKAKLLTPETGWGKQVGIESTGKSPSKRLRDVLFRYWEKEKAKMKFETFDSYYNARYEKWIEEYKEKLSE